MLDFDFTRQAHDRIDWTHMELGAMTSDMQNPVVDPIFDALVNQETVDVTIALAHGPDPADLPHRTRHRAWCLKRPWPWPALEASGG
ncbi:hypothetical protein RAA17_04795 [Komagataeibacter rhaeticus]|nr:hypothetical protein [Komagataeibacter rhaeticus]